MALSRDRCNVCLGEFALRADGTVRWHEVARFNEALRARLGDRVSVIIGADQLAVVKAAKP